VRVAQKLSRALSFIVFRDVDIRIHPDANFAGPTICVANHFGGLSDAVLIVGSLPVMPRVVARDVIWKTPVAGRIMLGLRAIPVHRRADGAGGANDDMFSSCFQAMAEESTILIFPEGVTQEPPHIAPVKTGAARIALGAAERGVQGIQIVPIGLHYADKAGFRDSVLVNIGPPIDVEPWLAPATAPSPDVPAEDGPAGDAQARVKSLTAHVERALREVAPDYPDWQTCRDFELAAEVLLHDVDAGSLPVRYGDRCLIADTLARRAAADNAGGPTGTGDGDGAELLAAVGDYRAQMRRVRARDLALRRFGNSNIPRSERNWIGSLLLVLLLSGYALIGLLMVLLPWLLVRLTRLARLAPAVQASVTPAVALLVFGLQWLITLGRGWMNDGFTGLFLGIVLPPFFVACALLVSERLVMLFRRLGVRHLRSSPGVQAAKAARDRVSDLAWELV
jgi:1-acyl-sn-glycerol-3-phosphate acyltransferase